jgi:hypothetical protein
LATCFKHNDPLAFMRAPWLARMTTT